MDNGSVLVDSAGFEGGWPVVAQVWVKVWGSYFKTFPDVPDFSQIAVSGPLQSNANISSQKAYLYS
jgi:hypothetical protein